MSDSEQTDERFEGFVQREAGAYNTPPDLVPRDEMWDAIRSARAEALGASAASDGTTAPRRRARLAYAWIGMAATLVIGVAIGRYAFGPETPRASQAGRDATALEDKL